ncbi:MAG: hypothetical protein H6811_04125 [Phycisphaeraceae bacterium]|nr:hypothetical protein [Phycisphaeraceae bacterium]
MRTAAVIATLALAGTANAQFIREVTTGGFDVTFEDAIERHLHIDATVVSEIGGMGFQTLSADIIQVFQPVGFADLLSGTATFTGANAGDTITLSLDGVLDGQAGQFSFSMSGLWDSTDAQGIYAGLSGSGDFSGSGFFTDVDTGVIDAIFQGEIIPAPGSAVAMALCGVVATRRRR